jgi:hypothetical protein
MRAKVTSGEIEGLLRHVCVDMVHGTATILCLDADFEIPLHIGTPINRAAVTATATTNPIISDHTTMAKMTAAATSFISSPS